MTDRINGFYVLLDHDIRKDDVEPLVAAVKQMRGVLDVQCLVSDFGSALAESRARHDLAQQLIGILYPNRRTP